MANYILATKSTIRIDDILLRGAGDFAMGLEVGIVDQLKENHAVGSVPTGIACVKYEDGVFIRADGTCTLGSNILKSIEELQARRD